MDDRPLLEEGAIPTFMTLHEILPEGMTTTTVAATHRTDLETQRRLGVRYLHVWFDARARKVFCLMEAPTAELVVAIHRETHGLRADRIYQVSSASFKGEPMTEPFVFIGTYRVKEGKLEAFREYWQEFCKDIEAKEPRLIAFNAYANEDGSELSGVQIHPDAESLLFHMGIAREHIDTAYQDYLDDSGSRIQIFGTPNDAVLDMIKQLTGAGVQIVVTPDHLGGFTRFAAQPEATAVAG